MPVAIPQLFISWQQFGSPAFNCSAIHEPGEWWSSNHGQQQLELGAWSVTFGAVSVILYLSCAIAMLQFRDRVCYRIMFWLAVVDIVAVYVNSISLGILFIRGAVYCTHPLYNFITGAIAVGTWCSASIGGLVLVLNRMRALLGKEGWIEHNTRSLLLFTSCYGAYYTLFTPPGCLNSKYQTLLFTPDIYDTDEFAYYSIPHAFNNVVIVSLSTLLYVDFLILLIRKSAAIQSKQSITTQTSNKSNLIQASLICLINVAASATFAYMNFIEASFSLVKLALICWQFSHGMPPFIYLFLNRTISRPFRQAMPVTIPQLFLSWQQYGSAAYNCSEVHEPGEWWSATHGQLQIGLGAWSVLFGIISLILYVPCTLAMMPLRRQACFKIMIWLAIVDIVALCVNSVSFGILLLQGAVYCTYPLYNYISGCIALGSWCGASIGGLVLVINRMRALLRSVGWMESNIRSVLMFTTSYWAYYTLFTPPGFVNSKYQTFLFNPVIYESNEFAYHSIPHAFNNIVIVSLSTLLYAHFLLMLIQKSVRNILIQASLICLFDVVASATFAYMNFIGASFSLMKFGQICWQLSHGMPPFIYLFLNRTIRSSFINRLVSQQQLNKTAPSEFQPSNVTIRVTTI